MSPLLIKISKDLKLLRCPRSLAPTLYVDHSHGPVLVPATLAALPSTRAIPNRDVFYVADPISSIRSKRFLRFFTGAHDRELAPAHPSARSQALRQSKRLALKAHSVSLIYHKPLMIHAVFAWCR